MRPRPEARPPGRRQLRGGHRAPRQRDLVRERRLERARQPVVKRGEGGRDPVAQRTPPAAALLRTIARSAATVVRGSHRRRGHGRGLAERGGRAAGPAGGEGCLEGQEEVGALGGVEVAADGAADAEIAV